MTTDITELAQSLKAAAEKAIAEEGSTWWNEEQLASDYGLALHRTDAKFIALASHENVLALVEALEKAQGMETYWKTQCRGITDHCEELQARIAELESRTVKMPEPFKLAKSSSGLTYYFADDVDAALTAAGIKVEGE
ncbi:MULTISPECIES: hypothetical protein [Klebsiella]|jgi:hypothetical protein|uniref:hypothetical protein n=1 Tax=Klebsiella TaxID=570 RepID=UPI00066665F2|nr:MULTISPECIES: hypothetical protein [Klebsiella]MBX4646446.1 hypothetical protein [Klebsiella michiganensis]MBZ7436602.1 hypothetical protein [Klebsiella michiganensis]MBZ7716598.1 hypothetical protein [Klebsiella oxytoca]MCW9543873.1 hypothetical protein [Klebsiella oxytoca]MCW9564735.1 hypothetical protein [Klebsiella oxytoca]